MHKEPIPTKVKLYTGVCGVHEEPPILTKVKLYTSVSDVHKEPIPTKVKL